MGSKQQTAADKLICGINDLRYAVVEPLFLKVNRALYEGSYQDPEGEPLISVYTPTYNRADLLMERAVPSVLAQTYQNFEYIVVGDCCTDKTEQYIRSLGDPRIRFYNMPTRGYRYPPTAENHWLAGPVVPANQGLKMARGKWIARVDDDDSWTPDHLEELFEFAQGGNFEFVSAQYVEERKGVRRIDSGSGALDAYYTGKEPPLNVHNPVIGGTSTWLYRAYLRFMRYNIHCWRKAWNRVNDVDLPQRIFKAGTRMGFLPKPLAFVYPRPGEDAVGLEAYLAQAAVKEEQFRFCG